jgi:hypothetical protein
MTLTKLKLQPGINKQTSNLGASGTYTDCDNIRFRYGLPEKIGGWAKNTQTTIIGVPRDAHHWVALDGTRLAALGTDKKLYVFANDVLYDITPIRQTNSSVTTIFTTINGSANVTVNVNGHGANEGDIVTFSGTTSLSGTSFTAENFDRSFEIQSVTSTNAFVIQQDANETTGSVTTGTATAKFDINSAPAFSTFGYGWGTNGYGGFSTAVTNLLNGALLDDTAGTGGSGTSITLDSTTDFSTAGKIIVDDEIISYTGKTSTNLTGITRAVDSSTRSAHADDSVVTLFEDSANANAWNIPSNSSSTILDGRDWSIDNFGELMIATALNGSTFQWSPTSDGFTGKASLVTNAPTASKFSLVSTPDRHLILFGTEKTVGTDSSQDPLLLRFSSQEDINTYEPRATNTAGSLRIQDGSTIVGADKARGQILVWTDTSLHGLQFIGPPFTFGLNQLGKNCGLLGQHAAVVVRDVSYWMGQNAFFAFDGTVKKLPCTVDDFVFENIDLTQTDQIFAGVNTEFAEIIWFYVTNPNNDVNPQINKCVVYNYLEQSWAVGTLNRTTWVDRGVFQNPFATEYLKDSVANATPTVIGLSNGVSRYYKHEFGNDNDGAAMQAFIQSGDFNIDEGGEQLMRIARFIPDFRDQTGNVSVTFSFKNYPYGNVVSQTATTVQTTDIKKDLRGRGRQANFKIESNVIGGNFKMGTFTIDAYPDGGR